MEDGLAGWHGTQRTDFYREDENETDSGGGRDPTRAPGLWEN